MKKKCVVVGNGMVGLKYVKELLEKDTEKEYEIIVYGEEVRPAYDRVQLTSFFNTLDPLDLEIESSSWYSDNGVTLKTSEKVIALDRSAKTLTTDQGTTSIYDTLILATGSYPFVPPIQGKDKQGVFVYRTIEDLQNIRSYSVTSKSAVVIGGGLLGLEAAKALIDLGMETHVIEFASRLMPNQIDDQGSKVLVEKIETLGARVHLNKASQSIEGKDSVEKIVFTDGTELMVDMIVVSAGIRPRDELAKQSGISIGERGGIIVDDTLKTNDPNVYAIGECALHNNFIYGLVAPGYQMATAAAATLLGEKASFEGADMSTKLKLMGVDVASIGASTLVDDPDVTTVEILNSYEGVYKKLIIDKESQTLRGAVFVGDASEYGQLLQYYKNDMQLPPSPIQLIVKGVEGDSEGAGVTALPDAAQICSCENISKGNIIDAVQDGATTVGTIKKCTKAGTGCGSCVSLIKDIMDHEIQKSGGVVDTALCEHFSYSRVALRDTMQQGSFSSFKEVITALGTGDGCEVCKTTVASILASYQNPTLLEQQNVQETNDYYLANIQKNGTYSIIPRIAGGEITAAMLGVLAEIGQEYDLYTKITGAQRIGLYGATVEQLPVIWERLIDAGFETGQAYAKSLRAVKSCVGQAWCRYGVGDSTQLAIDLENRYKGLRTPHKIKMGVSGCARECAEAQGKDFGIIATENGWNLYVCGNGGMKPQHAVLFAADIDRDLVLDYIDRIIMYYVRTADRLERTATWLNKLPGGLEHLKDVVIHDILGINGELEEEMKFSIDTFRCEWKESIENTKIRQRFKTFINSDVTDNDISFSEVRGQIQPAQ
ncbi:MAG: nitrite reductase large subunit NirB [Fibrobacterales bacterium]